MAEMKDMTIEEFAALTASDAPAPGGGSIAAYAAALSAALAEMVANLTIGKKGYEAHEERMRTLAKEAETLRGELIAAIKEDCDCFNAYMDALHMPKDTEEQKALRQEKMQEGLKIAAQVPLKTAQCAVNIFPLAEAVVRNGNKNAVTDGLVSALLARSAVLGALLNVKINLKSIKDQVFVQHMNAKVKALEEEAVRREQEVLALSDLS